MNPTAVEHLFRTTCALYALALAAYLVALGAASGRAQKVARVATGLAFTGLAAHSVWIGLRWHLAATEEMMAGQAAGDAPTWLGAFLSHPPLTNLYESLIVTAWCVAAVHLAVEYRWKLRPVGVLAMGVVLTALVEAFVVTEKGLRPLAPALQSWWLIAHVIIIFVAYAFFLVAAVLALLSLLKGGAPVAALGMGFSVSAALVLLAAGWAHGLARLAFALTPSYLGQGGWQPAIFFPPGEPQPVRWNVPVPGSGPLLALAIALLLATALLFALDLRARRETRRGLWSLAAGLAALLSSLGAVAVAILGRGGAVAATPPGAALLAGVQGPFRLSLRGNYGLGVLVLAVVLSLSFMALVAFRARALERLPERGRLEEMTYRMVLAGFPLLGLGIVMGALWAYDAWGSYWSWDPKETWSLVTFFVYALYLHTRRTLGWTGSRTAVIAIAGFALVIFTYLGVNLGLTGEGLHTYGEG
ncbi:MAG: cytochrome c biogenesis protein CcsA [Deltaproteobacteria bacterium]|nr:cytochrome c biogenesis protein CcsA [Deltaproteobacteria bacterium]